MQSAAQLRERRNNLRFTASRFVCSVSWAHFRLNLHKLYSVALNCISKSLWMKYPLCPFISLLSHTQTRYRSNKCFHSLQYAIHVLLQGTKTWFVNGIFPYFFSLRQNALQTECLKQTWPQHSYTHVVQFIFHRFVEQTIHSHGHCSLLPPHTHSNTLQIIMKRNHSVHAIVNDMKIPNRNASTTLSSSPFAEYTRIFVVLLSLIDHFTANFICRRHRHNYLAIRCFAIHKYSEVGLRIRQSPRSFFAIIYYFKQNIFQAPRSLRRTNDSLKSHRVKT